MERGRKMAVAGGMEPRKKGKLKTVADNAPFDNVTDPQKDKFKGSMIAPKLRPDDNALVIDPNLLVGPLYVTPASKSERIKEQLGDITEKLHKTLYDFDDVEDFKHEDPLVGMRQKLGEMDDQDMKSELSHFINQYDDMSCQVSAANRDRDEMLLQLADWFTTDHVDLDDIKASFDETEEEDMKQSYFSTITNFEKLKNLQTHITTAGKQGKSSRQLELSKLAIEKNVVDSFRVMKNMSMQTMKLNVSDDAPWRHAADEVVAMLNSVRSENSEEMAVISKKMQEMVDNLEKQAKTIKSLTVELREKKQVNKKLTDENSDLSKDVTVLRARHNRFEKDLQAAQTLIRRLHAERLAEGGQSGNQHTVVGKSLTESISKVLRSIEIQPEDKHVTSDPSLLRNQMRECQEMLESVRSEYARSAEEMEELNMELAEKKIYISDIEAENEKLLKDLKKLRQERRQSVSAGLLPPPAAGDAHTCEHCYCHISPKEYEEEMEELKMEVTKWQDKCNYFKKCLADTELKLSDAFREISDLRMERELPPPAPLQKEPDKEGPKEDQQKTAEDSRNKEAKPVAKPKPRRQVKAKYMETLNKPASAKLPATEQTPIDNAISSHFPGLSQKQQRELKLFKSGDIQGKLNMLTSEIMDFVNEIGNLLHDESDSQAAKVQAVKAFNFDSQQSSKKPKEVKDSKAEDSKQMKTAVIFSGQHACSKLREAFEMLSASLNLQHNEYEAIYRSFKISQQRNNLRREIFLGRMPISALQEFDRAQRQKMLESKGDNLLSVYYNISYGGQGGAVGVTGGNRNRPQMFNEGDDAALSGFPNDENESEAKLKNKMHVLSVQKSRSDVDTRDTPVSMGGFGIGGTGMMRERTQLFGHSPSDQSRLEGSTVGIKQEMRVGVAVVPRKGLISLSTNGETEQLPDISAVGEHRKFSIAGQDHGSGKQKNKSLIKRKDIMDHFMAGFKRLEDEEQQKHQEEELQKSLGEYTIMDLQSKILQMTDAKSVRRPGQADTPRSDSMNSMQHLQPEKTILPAIKNINPFAVN